MTIQAKLRGRTPTFRDHLLGLALCSSYMWLLLRTAGTIGMSRDEGIYVDAAQRYAVWLERLASDFRAALQQPVTDEVFAVNHEHPPLFKLLFAVGDIVQRKYALFALPSNAFRCAGMLSAGLLLWLIYVFGTRLYGRKAGLFAALCYALLPRPFYHAHLNAFDVPITCAVTAVTYAYYRSLREPRYGIVTGLSFGLALLTKHNSWILPGIFALHFALCALLETRVRKRTARHTLSRVPYWLFGMLLIGPALFLGGWPWLWHDTLARLNAYAAFHTHHVYYNMEYFGVNYFWPPFPISYAWLMTLFTVPLTTLVLGVLGCVTALSATSLEVARAWRARRPAPLKEPHTPFLSAQRDPTLASVLLLGCMLAPLVIISVPGTPIFGGTKHWFPAYPMLALFAGRAFVVFLAHAQRALRLTRGDTNAQHGSSRRSELALAAVSGALLLAPAAVETAHSHPFGLSHYTITAGGVPGAAEKGLNRQFWGFTTRSLAPYLQSVMPNGGTIYICDTIYWAWEMLVRDGFVSPNIRPVADIALADFAIVHHEKHFAEVDHEIWTSYGSVQPHHVLRYDGVPIISVYKNPRR